MSWFFIFIQVKANPSGALNSLVFMCKAIASWHVSFLFLYFQPWKRNSDIIFSLLSSCCDPSQEIRSEDLRNEICLVLQGYKQVSVAQYCNYFFFICSRRVSFHVLLHFYSRICELVLLCSTE